MGHGAADYHFRGEYDPPVIRALVIEDDPAIRDMIRRFLAPVALCDLAGDGVTGLAALEQAMDRGQPYELVCLDLVMPVMDGWETLARLRELEDLRGIGDPARVRVLVLTARDSSQNLARLRAFTSREGLLLKPFRRSDLFEHIRLLGRPV